MNLQDRPRIGIGVIVCRNDTVLLGKRKSSHGAGDWAFPGGHLEFGEAIFDCAIREVKEETGLTISNLKSGPYTNDIFLAEGKHYVTLFVLAECGEGEVQLLEPEKCEAWGWFSWSALPSPRFLSLQNLLQQRYRPPAV